MPGRKILNGLPSWSPWSFNRRPAHPTTVRASQSVKPCRPLVPMMRDRSGMKLSTSWLNSAVACLESVVRRLGPGVRKAVFQILEIRIGHRFVHR